MSKKAKFRLFLALFLALILLGMAGYGFLSTRVVTLKFREARLPGLPAEFDGTTVLFVSDLRADSLSGPRDIKRLMDQLMQTAPDILILGGDYTGDLFWDSASDAPDLRLRLFASLAGLQAPLGKFCVAGDMDLRLDQHEAGSLSDACLTGGFTLLRDEAALVTKDGATLAILGLDDWTRGSRDTGAALSALDGVAAAICVSHSPDALPPLLAETDSVLLALCGHTLGGQLRLPFFRMNPSVYGDRFVSGVAEENGVPVVVSQGIGVSRVPLRWGSRPDAYVITLRCGG